MRSVVAVAIGLAMLAGSISLYAVFRLDASKSEDAATRATDHAAAPPAVAPSSELVQTADRSEGGDRQSTPPTSRPRRPMDTRSSHQ